MLNFSVLFNYIWNNIVVSKECGLKKLLFLSMFSKSLNRKFLINFILFSIHNNKIFGKTYLKLNRCCFYYKKAAR
jgi:hypothetical protein